MQTATIREVQHHLSDVLKHVANGEEVEILRRRQPVARIVPLESPEADMTVDWSGHVREVDQIFAGEQVGGVATELLVAEGRGEY